MIEIIEISAYSIQEFNSGWWEEHGNEAIMQVWTERYGEYLDNGDQNEEQPDVDNNSQDNQNELVDSVHTDENKNGAFDVDEVENLGMERLKITDDASDGAPTGGWGDGMTMPGSQGAFTWGSNQAVITGWGDTQSENPGTTKDNQEKAQENTLLGDNPNNGETSNSGWNSTVGAIETSGSGWGSAASPKEEISSGNWGFSDKNPSEELHISNNGNGQGWGELGAAQSEGKKRLLSLYILSSFLQYFYINHNIKN